MEHNTQSTEITYHHEPAENTKRIWRTFWVLLILTLIELALGFSMYLFHDMPGWLHLFLKGVICILTLAKAYYIVSVFMHLGDEIRNMIMTVVVPLMLFIWFIAAFLWDGNSYRTMRNRYDKYKMERTMPRPVKHGDTTQHGFGG
ncbi:MAG TPA: cytochrome C oxidase subunit IV family protein [Flavisolibacter sp.]|nr:cytochrome C oxidase subunit IV family protein [Flavisolibacter sp.]